MIILIRCCVKRSRNEEEDMIKEVKVVDFNLWSEHQKLEELFTELSYMSKEGEEEIEKRCPQLDYRAANTASVVSAAKRLGVTTQQYYSARQKLLRSFNFTKKESFRKKTIKWFKRKLGS